MRRIALVAALLAVLLVPASASAASPRCSVDISPTVGTTTDVYRIHVSNVPLNPEGFGLEVRIDIRLLGTRDGSLYYVFLVPGATEFYVDHHVAPPGEPDPEPLVPGRYRVLVTTPHLLGGCNTEGQFRVI